MEVQIKNANASKAVQTAKRIAMTTGVVLVSTATAFAAEGDTTIDLTTGLAGVAIIGGLMASGTLKALPTYAAWGIKKALAMLR
ncbi:hypothetical protein I9189_010810 [Acinetobacter bereziniae]|uniref:hypothetical protein n=1 Tax=Acinetobacter TaxID=469 RepID=UPI001906C9D6|nr:hypothetical protein [Acinetobacter bereziniae]QQC82486.1 hypothetical protein I9192_10690 [Acinetobacter bereziniae]QQC82496.1 hypothetical protein I9192_10740 [Acinetobacter bereziniae]QQC82515.1 hypothetical protein I9192_10850 [Acinetobacter bereziniae]QQC82524.1 hypothetical protein I9192_10900 [Acinetobacter bereziniae]QQC82533.1 hypothetical protein I9192_10950 [Acinetobacter bereziniae]